MIVEGIIAWKAGDVAECIHGRAWATGDFGVRYPSETSQITTALFPVVGSTWIVDDVAVHHRSVWDGYAEGEVVYLALRGQLSPYCYDARHFRKIKSHLPDAEDIQTISLLNAVEA